MGLEFSSVSHAYGRLKVLDGINLLARSGEVTCLLGPSGCGKTTLLKLAAGLMPVQLGEVTLDGAVLAAPGQSLAPEQRPVGLVFQEGALFPHMTVSDNIAFGLKGSAAENAQRVGTLLSKIGLAGFEGRFPHTLSGGQQQRVALARALAPQPAVLLLDEPFANIDSQLRRDLREETRRVLKASGAVAILVTHDPDEALEMGDRIAVMDAGRVVQFDTPQVLYDQPVSEGVALLFGRGQPVRAAASAGGAVDTEFGRWQGTCLAQGGTVEGDLALVVRQDTFDLEEGTGGAHIVDIRTGGSDQLVFVEGANGGILRVQVSHDRQLMVGDRVTLRPRDGKVFCFDPA